MFIATKAAIASICGHLREAEACYELFNIYFHTYIFMWRRVSGHRMHSMNGNFNIDRLFGLFLFSTDF